MKKFVGLRKKVYSYLIDEGSEDKKAKKHKNVCHIINLNLKPQKTVQMQLTLKKKKNHLEENEIGINVIN